MFQNYALINSPKVSSESEENDRLQEGPEEYNIEEDDENIPIEEDKPEQGSEDDREDSEEEYEETSSNHLSPLKMLFELMMNPVNGWKLIRRSQVKIDDVAGKCYIPLITLSGFSCLLKSVYHANVSFADATLSGVKILVSLFIGYYLALLLIKILMPTRFKRIADSEYGKELVMFLISTLAIFFTLYQCLPMLGPALTFLPLWTIYLAIRGCRFFHFEEDRKNMLTTLICLAVFLGPTLAYWIFDIVL